MSTVCGAHPVAAAARDHLRRRHPTLVESCNECHGDRGISAVQDAAPIAGISSPVQAGALKAFKNKTHPCDKVNYRRGDTKRQSDMCSIAAKLSVADITALTDPYSRLG
jgi:cytochrome subunit of sulfide dehydrogenase